MRLKLERMTARLLAKLNRWQIFTIMIGLAGISLLFFLQTVFDQIFIWMGAKWSPLMLVDLASWAVSYIALAFVSKEFKRRYPNPRQSEYE